MKRQTRLEQTAERTTTENGRTSGESRQQEGGLRVAEYPGKSGQLRLWQRARRPLEQRPGRRMECWPSTLGRAWLALSVHLARCAPRKTAVLDSRSRGSRLAPQPSSSSVAERMDPVSPGCAYRHHHSHHHHHRHCPNMSPANDHLSCAVQCMARRRPTDTCESAHVADQSSTYKVPRVMVCNLFALPNKGNGPCRCR